MRDKYSYYEYEVDEDLKNQWVYKIYEWNDYHCCEDYISSDEWYDTEDEAYTAAINHIDRLESGE